MVPFRLLSALLVFFLPVFGASKIFEANELLNGPLRSQLTLPGIMDQVSEIFETPAGRRGKDKNFFFHLGVRNFNWLDFPVITPWGTHQTTIYQVFGVGAVGYKLDPFYVVGGVAGSGFGLAIPVTISNPTPEPGVSSYSFNDLYGPQFLDDIFFIYAGLKGILQVEAWLVDNKILLPQGGVLSATAPMIYHGQYWEVNAQVPFVGGLRVAMNNRDGFVLPARYAGEFRILSLVDRFFLGQAIEKSFPASGYALGSKSPAQFSVDYRFKAFKADTLFADRTRPFLYDRDNLVHQIWMSTPDLVFSSGLFLGAQADLDFYATDWSEVQGYRTLRSGTLTGRFGWTSKLFYSGLALKGGLFDDRRVTRVVAGFMGALELSLRPYLILRGSISRNDPEELSVMFDLLDKTIVKAEFKAQFAF